jgi:hypothetical protein
MFLVGEIGKPIDKLTATLVALAATIVTVYLFKRFRSKGPRK